jgi:hypothetical protein
MTHKRKVSAAQASFGAAVGSHSNPAVAPSSESRQLRQAVPSPEKEPPLYIGAGHGMFIESRAISKRGDRECRLDYCRRCELDTPHEYVCLQPKRPRVWGYSCTRCRREHGDHSRA